MFTLALDVDGVLLDSDRGGAGHWSVELERKYGVSRAQLREHFFVPCWDDVVNGRRPICIGHGIRVVLATNQENRRAAYLGEHLGKLSGWEAVHATPDESWIAEVLQRLDLPTL